MSGHGPLPLKVVEISPSKHLVLEFSQFLQPEHILFKTSPIETPVHNHHTTIHSIATTGSQCVARTLARQLKDVGTVFVVFAGKKGRSIFVQILRCFPRHCRRIACFRSPPLRLKFVLSLFWLHGPAQSSPGGEALFQSQCLLVPGLDSQCLINVCQSHVLLLSLHYFLCNEQETIHGPVANGVATKEPLKGIFDRVLGFVLALQKDSTPVEQSGVIVIAFHKQFLSSCEGFWSIRIQVRDRVGNNIVYGRHER
mmetsp:Transcript_27852/g.75782  ORF Transcript_27852/g.75782 Transcript_27852/m.75782 type:complete len:254 (-) Transcript_27852:215-976(-)